MDNLYYHKIKTLAGLGLSANYAREYQMLRARKITEAFFIASLSTIIVQGIDILLLFWLIHSKTGCYVALAVWCISALIHLPSIFIYFRNVMTLDEMNYPAEKLIITILTYCLYWGYSFCKIFLAIFAFDCLYQNGLSYFPLIVVYFVIAIEIICFFMETLRNQLVDL